MWGYTSREVCYIPFLSEPTELRNVFNASCLSSNGVSLIEVIYSGPKLQKHIFGIVTKIRKFKFNFSSDFTKMYRQILLRAEDQNRFRIL